MAPPASGASDPEPPAFYDASQSAAAAWDVWFSMQAGAQHIERLAQHRLGRLVAIARDRSPFYQDLYRDMPADACRIVQLPVVTKRELMANFDRVLTDPELSGEMVHQFLADERRAGRPLLDRYAVWSSSGTTGEPGIFLHDGRALAVYEALEVVRFRRLQSPLALAATMMGRDRYALVGATGGHFAGNATVERIRRLHPWLAQSVRAFSVLDSTPLLVEQLNQYQPMLLATYPTAASLLANEQRAGRLAIQPREIWTGGEQLSPAQRAYITTAFDCAVHDDYGASEFLAIAWECARGAMHCNADWVILEPVDERYRPVPAGVRSHTVLLTNLANLVQPLIRYDLGDSVTLLEGSCECGSALPAIRVEGRCDDAIVLQDTSGRGVTLLPLAIATVLEDEAGVFRFQLRQTGARSLALNLDPPAADAHTVQRCRRTLRRFLRTQGLPDVELDIERCALQRHPVSGKLRRVVAMTDAPQLIHHGPPPRVSRDKPAH